MSNDATVTETYTQMCERHQKEVDALPIHFAFGDKQFQKMLSLQEQKNLALMLIVLFSIGIDEKFSIFNG